MSGRREYGQLVRNIEKMIDRKLNFVGKNYTGYVSSVNPLTIHVNGLDLPDDAFRVAKSISVRNLRRYDQVLVTHVENDMPVVTALIRSDDDVYDSTKISGEVVVTGESVWDRCIYANGGIRIKTVSDDLEGKGRPPGPPSDDDFNSSVPVGTLALDITIPALYVKTSVDADGVGIWEQVVTTP